MKINYLKIELCIMGKNANLTLSGAGFIPSIGDGVEGDVVIDGEGEAPPPPCGLLCTMLREFQVHS